MISTALIRLIEVGDTPYVLCGDFNTNPQQSPAITGLISKGMLIDVQDAFGLGGQHTFSSHANGPPLEGVEGKGRTRIDTVLTNKAAFPLIKDCKIRWGLLPSDHAPIEVTVDARRYGASITTPKLQQPFPELKWTAKNARKKKMKGTELGRKHGSR